VIGKLPERAGQAGTWRGHRDPTQKQHRGLIYLAPGSLGDSTAHTWYFKGFPAPHGVRDALTFLNACPRQGEGEVSGYAHTYGSATIFYLEPGSH
jgi:hypothetical protein